MGTKTGTAVRLHPDILSEKQNQVLHQCGSAITKQGFYLAGGTAVALHIGHRRSIDFDWFTAEPLSDPLRLAQAMRDNGIPIRTRRTAQGTLHGSVSGVRITCLQYTYPLLRPLVSMRMYGCLIASLDDLACMKLAAISQRGSRKDFVDLFALMKQHKRLPQMLRLYERKYSVGDVAHLLYAMTYFVDAEKEPMQAMIWKTGWKTMKSFIHSEVKRLSQRL